MWRGTKNIHWLLFRTKLLSGAKSWIKLNWTKNHFGLKFRSLGFPNRITNCSYCTVHTKSFYFENFRKPFLLKGLPYRS